MGKSNGSSQVQKALKTKKKDNSTKRYRDKGNLQFWI